ncbi:MAG: hypothetical protein R3D62_11985 [Xanthobacteraceae bacterium]
MSSAIFVGECDARTVTQARPFRVLWYVITTKLHLDGDSASLVTVATLYDFPVHHALRKDRKIQRYGIL